MRVVASAFSIAYFASGGILSQEAIQWPRNSTPTGRHHSVGAKFSQRKKKTPSAYWIDWSAVVRMSILAFPLPLSLVFCNKITTDIKTCCFRLTPLVAGTASWYICVWQCWLIAEAEDGWPKWCMVSVNGTAKAPSRAASMACYALCLVAVVVVIE